MQNKSVPVPPRTTPTRRTRNQFKAWLIYRLSQAGATLPDKPSFADLAAACDRLLPAARTGSRSSATAHGTQRRAGASS